jgi:hypothetical protein
VGDGGVITSTYVSFFLFKVQKLILKYFLKLKRD